MIVPARVSYFPSFRAWNRKEASMNHLTLSRWQVAGVSQQDEACSGLIPQQASLVYLHQLTSYEKREIEDYPIVYTVGDYGSKNQTNHELGIFTLPNGSYCFKEGDHISYRYSIDEVLSSGYYAQVFRCTDKKTDKKVCIKLKNRNLSTTYEETIILLRIHQLNRQNNSNCVRMLDYDHFRGHHFIVLENYQTDLASYLCGRSKLTPREYIPMIKSIVHGLKFLHQNKIIHGDLKPANVLLNEWNRNNLKLTDFGLSTFVNQGPFFRDYQTLYYKAPEVFCQGKVSVEIDIWSLGCVAAEIVRGTPLFVGDNYFDQFALIQEFFGKPSRKLFNTWGGIHQFYTEYFFPRHCFEWLNPFNGDRTMEIEPHYKLAHPSRKPPLTSSLVSKLPGGNQKFLARFLMRCFEWDPTERIKSSFILNHPFFHESINIQ